MTADLFMSDLFIYTNTKDRQCISPPVYKPPLVYAHQKLLTKVYITIKSKAYSWRFTVWHHLGAVYMSPTGRAGLAVGLIFTACLHEKNQPALLVGIASFCK